jgi:transposase-like protein
MSDWTDELKASVVEAYEQSSPTPENTTELVKELAEQFDKTPNGIRMVLTRAGVYVKKTPASSSSAAKSGDGPKRVNKAEAIADLKRAIEEAGKDVDEDICDRLTGKAAVYIAGLIR